MWSGNIDEVICYDYKIIENTVCMPMIFLSKNIMKYVY